MKLTTYTDFGLRALMYLASMPYGQRTSVGEIASHYDISRNHMVKVVAQLVGLGYIHAVRGKGGGIELGKPAADINIGQVIRALESNLNGIDCHSPGCKLIKVCKLQAALKVGMEAFLTAMEDYTLADLVSNRGEIIAILDIPTN
ncbi:Rrf2 family transcriptional regulator [Hafnia paralvei]|uniref:Rrf2 family transcriptional regulator n=1 Tax=Hafnia paralvei TaxID=546367 RepID=UPI00300DB32E